MSRKARQGKEKLEGTNNRLRVARVHRPGGRDWASFSAFSFSLTQRVYKYCTSKQHVSTWNQQGAAQCGSVRGCSGS